MTLDTLSSLLLRADLPPDEATILTPDDLASWPEGQFAALAKLRLIVRAQPATTTCCNDCGEPHWEPVEHRQAPDGVTRSFIWCGAAGRIPVPADRLARWRIDLEILAEIVRNALEPGRFRSLRDGRLWGYFDSDVAGIHRDIFLVRGLGWDDHGALLELPEVRRAIHPLLLPLWFEPPAALVTAMPTVSGRLLFRNDGDVIRFDRTRLHALLSQADATPVLMENVFKREGQQWRIMFRGQGGVYPDQAGFPLIAVLLQRPGHRFAASELYTLAHRTGGVDSGTANIASGGGAWALGLSSGGRNDAGPVLTDETISKYKERLVVLTREREQVARGGDSVRVAQLDDEAKAVEKQLRGAIGLGGRRRRAADPDERARNTVARALARAIDKLAQDVPRLGLHLRQSIEKGTYLWYASDAMVNWET